MTGRANELESLLAEYARQVIAPMAMHFHVLATHLGRPLVMQVAAGMLAVKLRQEGAHPDRMPPPDMMERTVTAAIWPEASKAAVAELPFDCAKLIDWRGAGAVRSLLKQQCGTRRGKRLREGPTRAGAAGGSGHG
jgi:hypothetical protein